MADEERVTVTVGVVAVEVALIFSLATKGVSRTRS